MTSTWDSLDVEANEVASTTAQQAAGICTLLKQGISTLADGFAETEVKATNSAPAQMGLLSQNLNSLKCSVDLAMRGYYTQSAGLLRGVYENWIAFHYLAQFPKEANLWLCADQGKRPPSHSHMLNALGPNFPEHKADASRCYSMLCSFAHTHALNVMPHLGAHKGEPCAFFGATYKANLFRVSAYLICTFTNLMLREISGMIATDAGWQERCKTAIEGLMQFLEKENDEFNKSIGTEKANKN